MNFEQALAASDIARMQSGGRSIFEKLGDAATAGTAGAVISGLGSIYNTAVYASNNLFGTRMEEVETGKVLGNINRDWQRYYEENKDVIDTVGFIGGAFIPGGAAVKAFNAFRAGKGLGGARGVLGYTMHKQEQFLEAGLKQIAEGGASAVGTLNKNRLAAMAYGAVDNVLQAAVFESAAAVMMSRSPTLADKDWNDVAWDIAKSSLVGGAIGGGIEALWMNGIYKSAAGAVEKRSRQYDTIAALEKIDMSFGDRAFSIIDEAMALPKQVLEGDGAIPFKYTLNGRSNSISLDTSELMDRKLANTVQKAELKFQATLAEAVKSDPSVGTPFAAAMVDILRNGKAKGLPDDVIKQDLGTYLFNLNSLQSLGASKTDFTKEVVYLVPGASLRGSKAENAAELFSSVRASSQDKGYRIVGDISRGKYGTVGVKEVGMSVKEAWENGFDMVLAGKEGKVHINPASTIFKSEQSNEDAFLRVSFNTRTKSISDTPIATIADMAANGGPVVNMQGVSAGKYTFKFSPTSFNPTLDSLENSARHLWASQLTDFKGLTIDSRDFSLLDRLVQAPELVADTTKVKLPDGTVELVSNLPGFSATVRQWKEEVAQDLLRGADGQLDSRQLAYALNVEQGWVEQAVAAEFRTGAINTQLASRRLDSYASRDNVVLVYNKPPIADGQTAEFSTGTLGYQYRKQIAEQQADIAAHAVLRQHGDKFLDNDPQKYRGTFSSEGTGSSFLGFANANYDDLGRRWAQDVGRATHLTQQARRNEALDPLQTAFAKIIQTNNKQLGAVLQRVRFSDRSLALHEGNLVDLSSLKKLKQLESQAAAGSREAAKDLQEFSFAVRQELDADTYDFLQRYQAGHRRWLEDHNTLAGAQGRSNNWDPEALYLPPVDTQKVPYFAFVRGREGKIFGTSEVAMITGKNPDDLLRRAKEVEMENPDLQVIFKDDSELYKRALGDYDLARSMDAPKIDPLLRKQGHLGNFIPTLEPKAVVEEFVRYVGKREDDLVRSAVQVKYGQTFAELRWLSNEYTKVERSKFSFLSKSETKKVQDPFGDYIRSALNISKRAEYTIWSELNEFVDALGTRAYGIVEEAYRSAKAGDNDWIKANETLERVGLRGVFSSQEQYLANQSGADRSLVKVAVAKGNMLLANLALRLDTANALVNVVSSPILLGTEVSAIRNSLKGKDPALLAKFESAFQQKLPGGQGAIPSTSKLLYNAVANYFGPEKRALIDRYQNTVGSIRDDVSKFHDMLEDMALTPDVVPSKWAQRVDKAMETGAKYTGNNMAEQFTRFVASDVMRQITQPLVEAGQMTMKEQNSFIAIFVNRTQGNYISSQRPIMFQGVVGAAIGLFQTYQFNLFQQVFRHIENRDAKTLAIGSALQSTIFGLHGMPMFDAINTHLIGMANINDGHKDAYSVLTAADKEYGQFALYGALSAMPFMGSEAPALYTRGDLNPRHMSIVPTSFSQVPAVEAFSRALSTIYTVGNQVGQGAGLGEAMLRGMEHNGINRPLAGLAKVMQGRSTTGDGSMVAAHNDLISVATATRLIGAKPVDEAIALEHRFRQVAYKEADRERVEKLGAVVKLKIANGTLTEEDVNDFAAKYASVGGRPESYGAALQRWTRQANESEVNKIMRAHQTTYGQRMFEVMGGDPLPDFYNQPPEEQQ